ncbi:unnamed protein product [Ambrosiozyma monospora]|uniref:Unnamed protein product n=1 Tax=Ambrosiozyma monospora TaxID=43982 RepID=A0ACB5T1N3_AMBMO|nr:unnamed protein product [Ambrosiozyma monospora]
MDEVDSIIEESNIVKDNIKSFTSGGFGGVCAVVTGHPFDLVKVLLQTGKFKTVPSAFTHIVKTSGPLGFYKGVSSPLLGVTPMFAVSFWGYDTGKKIVYGITKKKETEALSTAEISAAGFLSAIPTTLIAAPFERVKVVMQISKEKVGFGETVKKLYKEGGIRSIYKGSLATLARDGPGSAVYFATYEVLKKQLTPGDGTDLSVGAVMTAGGFAGIAMCHKTNI